ncbi:MAG: acylphosphatase [Ignavibacteria bacterium]|nr:acylphosphatase [Ignavibacteria bacterium]
MQTNAEIIVNGLVQGVGYRYFVFREAQNLGLKGYVINLYTGEVLIVAEGEKALVEELINKLRIGPMHAAVKNCFIEWRESTNEFDTFEIR